MGSYLLDLSLSRKRQDHAEETLIKEILLRGTHNFNVPSSSNNPTSHFTGEFQLALQRISRSHQEKLYVVSSLSEIAFIYRNEVFVVVSKFGQVTSLVVTMPTFIIHFLYGHCFKRSPSSSTSLFFLKSGRHNCTTDTTRLI